MRLAAATNHGENTVARLRLAALGGADECVRPYTLFVLTGSGFGHRSKGVQKKFHRSPDSEERLH